jgi:type IV pilus assembly protein PilP
MTRLALRWPAAVAIAAALGTSSIRAQGATTGVATAPATAPAVATSQPAAPPAAPDPFTYEPTGRRDPFVSLVARGSDSKTTPGGHRGDGLAGLSLGEVSVRGVLRSHGGYVAILQGPDNKTYIARQNDKLFDGTIRSISEQGLTVLQEVNDPLSLVKQREVHKGLRASDEGK